MLEVLNEDVLKLISTRDHKTWFSVVQTCTYFQRFNEQDELKQKFLIKVVNIEGWKVRYILPNGKRHNYEEPSITVSGSQIWYQNGKCHRDGDLPASIWGNGDQEWYQTWTFYSSKLKTVLK